MTEDSERMFSADELREAAENYDHLYKGAIYDFVEDFLEGENQ